MNAAFLRSSARLGAALSAQLIVSATSLALSFLLMHVLSVDEYGMYVLAAAGALFASGLFNATFTSRVAAAVGGETGDGKARLVRDAIAATASTGLAVAVVGLAAWVLLGRRDTWLVPLFCALTLMRDGGIRVVNAAGRSGSALRAAAVFSVLALATALPPLSVGSKLSLSSVLGALSIALLAALVIVWRSENVTARAFAGSWRRVLQWFAGVLGLRDWLALGFLVVWMQSQAILFVASHYFSQVGVARLAAARLFLSPLVFLSQALAPLVIAKISNPGEGGAKRVRNYLSASAAFACVYLFLTTPLAIALSGVLFPSGVSLGPALLASTVGLGALQFVKDSVRYVAVARRLEREIGRAAVFGLLASLLGCGAAILSGTLSLPLFVLAFCAGEVLSIVFLLRWGKPREVAPA